MRRRDKAMFTCRSERQIASKESHGAEEKAKTKGEADLCAGPSVLPGGAARWANRVEPWRSVVRELPLGPGL